MAQCLLDELPYRGGRPLPGFPFYFRPKKKKAKKKKKKKKKRKREEGSEIYIYIYIYKWLPLDNTLVYAAQTLKHLQQVNVVL